MALCVQIHEISPKVPYVEKEPYLKWLESQFRAFADFEFKEIDAKHLVAIACASYEKASTRSLEWSILFRAGLGILKKVSAEDVGELIVIQCVRSSWDEGLAGVDLTSVGSIVGGLALGQIKNVDLGKPGWSEG